MNRTIATETMWLTKFANTQFLVGVLVLLCALTFYYFAVLRIDYTKTTLLDLGPYPDATEYFAQAKALRRDAWPYIQIGYEKLPSRYPFGYPMLMLPWLKVLRGTDSVLAPFRTNQTMGLLLLLAVFAFYLYLAMPLTGGFAVLFSSRSFIKRSNSVAFLCTIVAGDRGASNERCAPALVFSLRCRSACLRGRG